MKSLSPICKQRVGEQTEITHWWPISLACLAVGVAIVLGSGAPAWGSAYYTSVSALTPCGLVTDTGPYPTSVMSVCGPDSAMASAGFGSMGVSGSGADGGGGSAGAGFVDYITVSGGTGLGTLSFGVDITGSINGGAGSAGLDVAWNGAHQWVWTTGQGGNIAVSISLVVDYGFRFGQPFQFVGSAQMFAASFGVGDAISADFTDPIHIAPGSLVVRDANGNIVNGATVTSDSGTNYFGTTPEPSTGSMVIASMLAGFGWWRRRGA